MNTEPKTSADLIAEAQTRGERVAFLADGDAHATGNKRSLREVAEELDTRVMYMRAATGGNCLSKILELIQELCTIAEQMGVPFEAHDDNSDWKSQEELLIDVLLYRHQRIGPCIDQAVQAGFPAIIVC